MKGSMTEYEIEMTLAGRSVFLTASIDEVKFKTTQGAVEWSSADVAMSYCDQLIWESVVKPEDLDLGRVDSDLELFNAIQEVAESASLKTQIL